MTCCERIIDAKPTGEFTVALAGNPNSGKTTIFNGLTGLRQKVANYPGVTVEKKTGRCKLADGEWIHVIDLPGTYSLISRSPDEQVAMEVLRGMRKDTKAPDAVIVVVDASNLQRNLYLVSQLIELGKPMVVALNMMDIAERRGLKVSAEGLSTALGGVPVVGLTGHRGRGIEELKARIAKARVAPLPAFNLPAAMREELLRVGGGLAVLDSRDEMEQHKEEPAKMEGGPTRSWICQGPDEVRRLDRYEAIAERLLIGDRAADIAGLAGREPVKKLLEQAHLRLLGLGIDPMQADIEAHYQWIESTAHAAMEGHAERQRLDYARKPSLTERVDRVLIHRVWGLLFFGLVMGVLFVSIFWLASPLMDGMTNGTKWLGGLSAGYLPEGPIRDLWTDGIVAGVGAVVVFVPQIAMLFLFLAILEDSGYLARAAFLMDRLLGKVGLSGKSFIPLLSSFACAIPGIMATRTIESKRDRLATIFVAPFMSCSARLPVYFLLIGTFFAAYSVWVRAGLMLSMYLLGILAAVGTAFLFRRTFLKGAATSFILELPTYKPPQASQVGRVVVRNTWQFVTKAGTTIFCLSVVLWGLAYYPRLPKAQADAVAAHVQASTEEQAAALQAKPLDPISNGKEDFGPESDYRIAREPAPAPATGDLGNLRPIGQAVLATPNSEIANDPKARKGYAEKLRAGAIESIRKEGAEQADKAVASAQLQHSLAGRFGHMLEPVIKPLGYDWKMGIGLVSAFAAREVFVSTMAITYAAGDEDNTADLSTAMRGDRYANGTPVWTPVVALSLLVWFVLAMQCMSTVAIVRRETGGWGWPVFMIVYMNVLAYGVALLVYQVGMRV